jgi:hypothetical protein
MNRHRERRGAFEALHHLMEAATRSLGARLIGQKPNQYAPFDGHGPRLGTAAGASRRIGAQYPPLSRWPFPALSLNPYCY